MKNFLENTNKAGKIAGGAIALGALTFVLWAIAGESDGAGAFLGNLWIFSVACFVFGFIYLMANSGRRP